MINIQIDVDSIDYANAVSLIFPILQQKAQESNAVWATILCSMKTPDEKTVRRVLELLPQNVKDELAVHVINKYINEIPEMLTSLALSKGISMDIREIRVNTV